VGLHVRGNSKIRTLKEPLGALNKTQDRGPSLAHFILLPLEGMSALYVWNSVLGKTLKKFYSS